MGKTAPSHDPLNLQKDQSVQLELPLAWQHS